MPDKSGTIATLNIMDIQDMPVISDFRMDIQDLPVDSDFRMDIQDLPVYSEYTEIQNPPQHINK